MLRVTVAVLLVMLSAALGGCVSSPEKLFETGRDSRVYNPQTGRYEWQ